MNSVWAVIQDGKIEPLKEIMAPNGTRVLVTVISDEDSDFWLTAYSSSSSLDEIWNNTEDDRYAELLNN